MFGSLPVDIMDLIVGVVLFRPNQEGCWVTFSPSFADLLLLLACAL
jgi:hypothetical protein